MATDFSKLYGGYTGPVSNNSPTTVTPSAPANKASSTTQRQPGNWFTHALPAIGGTVAGVATLPLEALDAVSGVGGTALNVGAAGLGAAAGKALENRLENNQDSLRKQLPGIAGQGLIGGVSAGVGNAVAPFLGPVISKVTQPIAEGVGNLLGRGGTEAASEIAPAALKEAEGVLGQNIEKAAPKLNPGVKSNFLLDKAPQLAELTTKLGITPKDYEAFGNAVTGSDGALNNIKTSILGGVEGVDTTGLKGVVDKLVNDAHELTGPVADKLSTNLGNKITNASGDVGGSLTGEQTHSLIQALNSSASKSFGKPEAAIYKGLANELNDRLGAAGADKAVADFTVNPKDLALIQKTVANEGFTGQTAKNIEDYIVNSANGAKSLNALKSAEAPAVNLSQIGEGLRRASVGSQSIASKISGGKGFGLLGKVLNPVLGIASKVASGATQKGVTGMLKSLISGGGVVGAGAQALGNAIPGILGQAQYGTAAANTKPQTFSQPSDGIRQLAQQATQSGQKIPTGAVSGLSDYQTGLNELNNIQDSLNGSGDFGTITSRLQQSEGLVEKATGLDKKTTQSLLPTASDDPHVVQQKLTQLKEVMDRHAEDSFKTNLSKGSGYGLLNNLIGQ